MKYRKRPLEVDAVRVHLKVLGGVDSLDWVGVAVAARHGDVGSIRLVHDPVALRADFEVVTPHGPIKCRFGDWVVRDQFGHLHPYTDEHFRLIFEEVDDAE